MLIQKIEIKFPIPKKKSIIGDNLLNSGNLSNKSSIDNIIINIKAEILEVSSHRPFFQIKMINITNFKKRKSRLKKFPYEKLRITIPPQEELFNFEGEENKDFLREGLNIAKQKGIRWNTCWNVVIQSEISINMDVLSKSERNILKNAWLEFLIRSGNHDFS